MRIRRRQRPPHAQDDTEDLVIDLRERLAIYDQHDRPAEPVRGTAGDSAPISARKPRPRTARSH